MNDFEKYLKDNKRKLDIDQINPELWLAIENTILKEKHQKSKRYLRVVSVAAAVLLLGIVSWFIFQLQPRKDIHAQLLEKYGLEVYDFPQQLGVKKQLLVNAQIPADRKEDFMILLNQMKFLDDQYHDYLEYLELNGHQEFIGKQILNYYKNKIELLDKIQSEINKIEEYENKYQMSSPKVNLSL